MTDIEKRRERHRRAYAANAEAQRARARAKRQADPDKVREQWRTHYNANTAAFVARNRVRKQRIVAAGPGPDRLVIFQRDGWICYLCGQPTFAGAPPGHPRAPTIDHMKPLSEGGTNAPDNLLCACKYCNERKGARPWWECSALLD